MRILSRAWDDHRLEGAHREDKRRYLETGLRRRCKEQEEAVIQNNVVRSDEEAKRSLEKPTEGGMLNGGQRKAVRQNKSNGGGR